MKRHLATAFAITVLTSGCATLLGGGPSQFSVDVQEPRRDLEVRLEGLSNGEVIIQRVPEFTVSLSRSSDYRLTVRSPLYQTQEIRIGRSIRGAFWANLLLLPLFPVGMGVDAYTGNMWEHHPQKVTIRLEPARKGSSGNWVLPVVVSSGLKQSVYEAPILK